MFQEIPDLVLGALFFTTFLVLAVFAGGRLNALKKSRHIRALAPLGAVIGGTVEGDEYAAWMAGTYRGRPVKVKMTPGRNISESSEYITRINSFEINVPNSPGRHSWEVAHQGLLRKKWVIKAQNDILKEKLNRSRMVDELTRMGNHPSIRYDARDGSIWYHEDIQPRLAPTLDRFREQLRLLEQIAAINQELNGHSTGD